MGKRRKKKKQTEAERDTLPAPPPSEPGELVIVEKSPGFPVELERELLDALEKSGV